ncbi:hypothetical protein LCGC14_0527520 [marine sediment metagenome]|uniref:Uncharacterized protein n=1 Tax=marine sediment metagenome TaxID=412755 RepID=A0A0F9UI24_9ZZZZ
MTVKGAVFLVRNWKLVVHLLLGTKRFGVNNQGSNFDSMFARKGRLTPRLIIRHYRMAKHRATVCGFLTRQECKSLGWESSI